MRADKIMIFYYWKMAVLQFASSFASVIKPK